MSTTPPASDPAKAALARLRHDLRTPLNQIIGYSELLLETLDEGGTPALEAPLQAIQRAGTDLLELVVEELAPWKVASGQHDLTQLSQQSQPPLDQAREASAASRRLIEAESELADDLAKIEQALDNFSAELATALATPLPSVSAGTGTTTPPTLPSSDRDHGHLLVVDDDPLNREMLGRRLEHMGFTVTLAADGYEALQILAEAPCDLVLLDMVMPGLDGHDTLARIKAHEAWGTLPVVMLSALDDAESTTRCIMAGAEDYVPKPFNPVILQARIRTCLEMKRLRDLEAKYRAEQD